MKEENRMKKISFEKKVQGVFLIISILFAITSIIISNVYFELLWVKATLTWTFVILAVLSLIFSFKRVYHFYIKNRRLLIPKIVLTIIPLLISIFILGLIFYGNSN